MLERRHLGAHLRDRAQPQQREHALAPQLLLRMGYDQALKPTPHRSADEVTFTGRPLLPHRTALADYLTELLSGGIWAWGHAAQ